LWLCRAHPRLYPLSLHDALPICPERGRCHWHSEVTMQIVTLPYERLVWLLVDFDVQITGRATTGPDFALTGQPDPHTVTDTRRYLGGHLATHPDPAVTTALLAGVGDDLTEALTHRARPRGDHLAQERALHRLDLALALAGVTRLGGRSFCRAGASTEVTQDRGVDRDLLVHPGSAFLEAQ